MDQPGKVASPARGQLNRTNEYFPVRVRSCLRIWSCKTGSAVPSRVSLLISILEAESGAYLRNSSRGVHLFIYNTAIRHRVSPEFIGSRNCVPLAFTAESPLARGQ